MTLGVNSRTTWSEMNIQRSSNREEGIVPDCLKVFRSTVRCSGVSWNSFPSEDVTTAVLQGDQYSKPSGIEYTPLCELAFEL